MNFSSSTQTAFQALESNNLQVRTGAGVTMADVKTAEDILNLRFPQTLREFFLRFGSVQIGGDEIYGLSRGLRPEFYEDDCPLIDLVYFNLKDRKNRSSTWVLLLNNDGDRRFYLDTSTSEDPVVFFVDVENSLTLIHYADNFGEFLLRRLEIVQ